KLIAVRQRRKDEALRGHDAMHGVRPPFLGLRSLATGGAELGGLHRALPQEPQQGSRCRGDAGAGGIVPCWRRGRERQFNSRLLLESEAMAVLSQELRQRILDHMQRYPSKQAVTLPALHLVHDELHCVPLDAIREIADLLDLSPAEVHDTMSFYGFF